MIKNINFLRDFGIYENHDNTNCTTFSKYNLIYGWNGAGKSTLTKLFKCIEDKSIDQCGYLTPRFQIECDDGEIKEITEKNISSASMNIFTFNADFVRKNIDWDSSVNSILLIDKDKIEDRKSLVELKLSYKKLSAQLDKEVHLKKDLDNDMQAFLTKAARNIKTNLQVINTQERRYLNYNKTTLFSLINSKRESIFKSESLLQDIELGSLTRAALPIEMPIINMDLPTLNIADFVERHTQISAILHTSVASNVILALSENPNMQSWVEMGLALHKENHRQKCGFCGGDIKTSRVKELNDHFNDAFKAFKKTISNSFSICSFIPQLALLSKDFFFPEFQGSYIDLVEKIRLASNEINHSLGEWQSVLTKKNENPFETSFVINEISIVSLMSYNTLISGIKKLIDDHNSKSLNFSNEITKIKSALEVHYAARELIDFKYEEKERQKGIYVETIDELLNSERNLKDRIDTLEASLSNESIAENVFNNELHRFLGRSEIRLSFDAVMKGYRIIRNGTDKHAKNLSEGEKTAIAFVYFAIKVDEGDNDITKSIIVVDDPVSSFDSNHLFHSYAFLKKRFENACQLFILTHSFSYFKLVRDWILKKNKRDNIKSRVYLIETYIEGVRKAKIINASSNLIDYNSEYHYLYSRLKYFKEKAHLELDEVYLCANLSRKLLETFLSFKFPKKRSNFKALVDDSVRNLEGVNQEEVEKLYRFINKYSHNQEIDMGDNTDNLLGESPVIIKYLFTLIESFDSVHFAEMESLAV
jgi:wobble nucleotide-excising tRNase